MKIIPQDFDHNIDIATVLKRLYLVTGMTATIYNSKKYWVTSYPLYNCSYCNSLRQNNDYHMRCRANDAEAFEMCAKKRETIIYRCYMGLYEIMIPLFDLDNICGYLLLGQAMEDGDEARRGYCRGILGARPDMTEEMAMDDIARNTAVTEEKLRAIAHIAQTYAEYISEKNIFANEVNSLANLASVYIREHLTQKITNDELCYVFLCDRKKLVREFKEAHGMSIVDYTNNLRLRKARHMLQKNPDLSISYVSSSSGFSYQSYFSKLFIKKYGISPTEMQRRYKEELENKEKEGENNGEH